MSLITLRQALDLAKRGGYGVGAFNVSDLTQVEAVLDAAAETASPVIVQTIVGASAHRRDELFWAAILRTVEFYPEVPVVVHLDHGPTEAACRRAIDAGFSSVMIDGSIDHSSGRINSFDENVEVTAKVVEYAHSCGVSVEGELGTIGGSKDGLTRAQIVLADPEQAERFVAATGVDALAVAIGTSHGAYKFDSPPDGSVLHMELIAEIASRVPSTHLVMHGSSSLPEHLRDIINAHGGSLPPVLGRARGREGAIDEAEVTKINQGMDSHMAYMAAMRTRLAADGMTVDPAPAMGAGRAAMQELIAERMRIFGQAGHAQDA